MKYYISCDTATEIKAICIMDEEGFVHHSSQYTNEKEFEKQVQILSNFYSAEKIEEREVEYKPIRLGNIPNINKVIGSYLRTEKGRQNMLDYMISSDAIDMKLIEELKNFKG